MTIETPKKWRSSGNTLCHLVVEFSDGGDDFVVYKFWWKGGKRWIYKTQEKWILNELTWKKESTND